MLLAVSQGQVDVAADGITYTADRAQSVDFSSLYQSYDETLLVRADEDRFTTSAELKALPGYLVATQIGTTNEITAHNLFGAGQRQVLRALSVAAIQALLNNDVDAVVVDRPGRRGLHHVAGRHEDARRIARRHRRACLRLSQGQRPRRARSTRRWRRWKPTAHGTTSTTSGSNSDLAASKYSCLREGLGVKP